MIFLGSELCDVEDVWVALGFGFDGDFVFDFGHGTWRIENVGSTACP